MKFGSLSDYNIIIVYNMIVSTFYSIIILNHAQLDHTFRKVRIGYELGEISDIRVHRSWVITD